MKLVNADAMMKHLEDLLCGDCNTPRKEGWCDVCDYAFLMNEMKKEPTVEPKHGHWINHFNDLFPADGSVECSVCHEYEGIMVNDNYCPNCGAKMDGITNETD